MGTRIDARSAVIGANWWRSALLACLMLLVPMLAGGQEGEGTRRSWSGKTMGPIDWQVIVVGDANRLAGSDLEPEIQATLDRVNALMSTYRDDSDVTRFNRTDSLDWFPVDQDTAQVVARALEISRSTKGSFDITVGPAVELWNFGPDPGRFELPSAESVTAVLARVGYRRLEARLEPPALRKTVSELEIDLSAIAKGYAVDQVSEMLARGGWENSMVVVGGEVRCQGEPRPGESWRIGIENPIEGRIEIARKIVLDNRAVATSGDYRNFRMVDGKRYSHTIDPRTARPVENGMATASVIAEDCMTADAVATAVMVMGPDAGHAYCRSEGFPVMTMKRDVSAPLDLERLQRVVSEDYPLLEETAQPREESGIIGVFLAAALVFGIAVLGMAVGAIFANRPVRGSCGGLANMPGNGDMACGVCEKPSRDCVEKRENADSPS